MAASCLSTPLETVAKAVGASPLCGISLHWNVQLQAIAVFVLWQDNLVPRTVLKLQFSLAPRQPRCNCSISLICPWSAFERNDSTVVFPSALGFQINGNLLDNEWSFIVQLPLSVLPSFVSI